MHPRPQMPQERKMLTTEFILVHKKAGHLSRFFIGCALNAKQYILCAHYIKDKKQMYFQ